MTADFDTTHFAYFVLDDRGAPLFAVRAGAPCSANRGQLAAVLRAAKAALPHLRIRSIVWARAYLATDAFCVCGASLH